MKPFFKKHGFQYKSSVNVEVWKEIDRCVLMTWFQVDSLDTISMYLPQIRYKQVEVILYEITGMDIYNPKYNNDTLRINKTLGQLYARIYTREDLHTLATTFKQVFEQEYLPAFEKYHDPHQVLKLWDSLNTVEEKNNYFFDTNNYSKILIISKLCNDVEFERRVKESLDYYELLKSSGKSYFQENLSYCERVIAYLEENVP